MNTHEPERVELAGDVKSRGRKRAARPYENRTCITRILLATIAIFYALSGRADARQRVPVLARHAVLGAGAAEADGGIRLTVIVPDSAADRAGLRVGDIVTKIGNDQVRTPTEFLGRVKVQRAGKVVDFDVLRGGSSIKAPVVLTSALNESDPAVKTRYESLAVDGSLRRTLLTLPAHAKGVHPAVLIIGGIGCYSIDNAADHDDAYMRLTRDLGRRGIVGMRLEKSGVGDSQGPPCMTVDLHTEMRSYQLALEALLSDPNADPKRIYIFGHSIGTLIAPRIAEGRHIAGIILAEGVGRNWIEYELANLRRQLELAGQPPDKIDALMHTKEVCMHRLLVDKEAETDIVQSEPACKELNTYPAPPRYLQQAASLNVAEPWMKLFLPVLAIYGTADFITTQADHQRIIDIVNATRPGIATLTLIPEMDHHLDSAGSPQQAYDLRVKQHGTAPYQAELSKAVLDWLCLRERCNARSPAAIWLP